MQDFYISFGQVHAHKYDGKLLHIDVVAKIRAESEGEVRRFAQAEFENKYMTVYSPERLELKFFPGGIIDLGFIPQKYQEAQNSFNSDPDFQENEPEELSDLQEHPFSGRRGGAASY